MRVPILAWPALLSLSAFLTPMAPAYAAPARIPVASVRVQAPPAFLRHAQAGKPLAGSTPVTATVVLASRHPAALARYAARASNPHSPLFRHWLTPRQVLSRFGPSLKQRRQVVGRLESEGLTAHVHSWTVTVSGPARVWTHLLHTAFRWYDLNGVHFRGQAAPARLPAWLARSADGISGLTTYAPPAPLVTVPRPRPMAVHRDARLKPASTPGTASQPTPETSYTQNFSVTESIAGPVSQTTGLPEYVVFQATYNGQPDDAAGLGPNSFAGATSTGQSPYGWALSGLSGGYSVVGIDSPYALTAQVSVTVYAQIDKQGNPVQGTPSVTFNLPALSWSGPSTTLNALDAEQINALYDGAGLQAQGPKATVGIIAVAPPSQGVLKALGTFTAENHLTPATVTTDQVTTGKVPAGWSLETDMDLQAAETTAPGAHVVVYADPTLDLGAFFQAVANHPVPVVSLSLGGSGIDSSIASVVNAVGAEGVTISVSSGDFGSVSGSFPPGNTPEVMPPAVSEPADLVPVTAVGGTDVSVDASDNQAAATQAWGGSYLSLLPPLAQDEMLWSYAATGGGFSQTQPIPPWQENFLPPGSSGRGVPDIALMADPYVAGILMTMPDGTQEIGGGTSLGAPLMAGWTADMAVLTGKPVGNLDPILYQLASTTPTAFTQAAQGDNGAYQITSSDNTPGTWNPLTGLGSPDIGQLANAVVAAGPPSVGVSFSQDMVAIPSAVVISATSINLGSPEYRLRVETPWNQVWHETGWQTTPWWQYPAPLPGGYVVQVLARSGQQGPVVKSSLAVVQFTSVLPQVSNLTVQHFPMTASLPVGKALRVRAIATDPHGKPYYLFEIKGPSGHWVKSGWQKSGVIAYESLKPGQYQIEVLALDQSLINNKKALWQAYRRSINITVTASSGSST